MISRMFTRLSSWKRVFIFGALCTAILANVQSSSAANLYYWDTNGSNPGAGASPSGTWGEDPNWNSQADGTGETQGWPADQHAVFSAGDDATSAYTVTVSGTRTVGDIHFDNGSPTLQGGTLGLDNGNRLISVLPGNTATINTTLASKNAGQVNRVTKYKMGTLVLGGANTYSGETMIEGGMLQLGASERIPNTSRLLLGNGGTDGFVDTPATFHTGGFDETLGTLKLTGPNPSVPRTINFGHGSSALVFADSSSEDWEGIALTIVNYTPGQDSLRFGTSSSGLTASQLDAIKFSDYSDIPGRIDANGFVSPALPIVTSVTGGGTASTTITWSALFGRTYRVQYKSNLNENFWNDLFPDVTAWDNTASASDDTSGGNERYYRVVLLP